MLSANQLRVGMIVVYENAPHIVLEAEHRTPGNKRGFMQTKLRNCLSGMQTTVKFGSSDRVEKAFLEEKKMQFLYREGGDFHFMDIENYEQCHLDEKTVGDAAYFLLPESVIGLSLYEDKAIAINLPKSVDLKVIETEPELKGATAASSYKPAKLETGLQVKVPPFVREGDKVRIDTSSRDYLTRVND